MSRRVLRKSSFRNSPKFTPSPRRKKSTHSDAFLFEVEHIERTFSLKPNNERFSNVKKLVAEQSTPGASFRMSARQKRVQDPMLLSPQVDINSQTSETNEEENISKQVKRRKKIRNTQELNNLVGDERYSEVGIKVKTKKTKKNKVPYFLPPVDMVEEDKNPSSAFSSTDSDNKENDNNTEGTIKLRQGHSRRTRKRAAAKKNSGTLHKLLDDQKPSPSMSFENHTTDSDSNREHMSGKKRMQMTEKESERSRKPIQTNKESQALRHVDEDCLFVVQDNTIGTTLLDRSVKFSNSKNKFLETADRVSVVDNIGKKHALKREGTFEISSRDPVEMFSEDFNNSTAPSTRDTYCIVPEVNLKVSKKKSIPNAFVETIDLTESLSESPQNPDSELKSSAGSSDEVDVKTLNRKSVGTTATNSTFDSKKSSFEVSFNINKEGLTHDLLDNLNITRRPSKKSICRKSSRNIKYSNGSEDEDIKTDFITLRRHHHTMIDFATTGTSDESFNETNVGLKKYKHFEKLNDQELNEKSVCMKDGNISDSPKDSAVSTQTRPSRRTGILKSVGGERVDIRTDVQTQRDIFDVVSNTPTAELNHMMIENGESVLINNTFAKQSFAPRLSNMETFCMDQESLDASQIEGRKSTRKRWSQVEKVSILDYTAPRVNSNDAANTTKTKSVSFYPSPPESKSPLTRSMNTTSEKELTRKMYYSQANDTQNMSKLKTVSFLSSPSRNNVSNTKSAITVEAKKLKGKKSVKIESPALTTPKIRLHSPLIMRKTPLPYKKINSNNSIVAGNCAFSVTPPKAESTPYIKKREVNLLKKVLTNEKSKGEKSVKCLSSRVKMPNFRKIHERQFEKMENIKELQERKAIRAQYLLSGNKIISNASTSKDVEKESRKKLLFSPLKTEAAAMPKISKPLQHMLNKRASLEKKKKALHSKVPVVVNHHLLKNQSDKNPSISSQKFAPSNVARSAPDKEVPVERKPETKQRTRLGFKLPVDGNSTKEAQIKAVAAKAKVAVDRREQNRKKQTTVRTNRRFELLMQMRAKKK